VDSVTTIDRLEQGDSPAHEQGDSPTDRLTLGQAAQRLGHSEKTLRRWIKSGRLQATLEPGPYGPQYWVSTQAVQTAQQVLDVVTVERAPDQESLALAVAQAIAQRDAALRAELASMQAKLDAILARVDSQAPQCPETPAPRPWWAFWRH
jgi:excisionase family DNA binding protein